MIRKHEYMAALAVLLVGVFFIPRESSARTVTPSPTQDVRPEIMMESHELDIFVGGDSRVIVDHIPEWDPVYMPRITWSVEDLPPALTGEFDMSARPDSGTLMLHADSSAQPGDYTVMLTAQTVDDVWTAPLEVRVLLCQPFYATGELVTGEVKERLAGGTSTLSSGTVWPLLRFCSPEAGRMLHITVTEVITEQGNRRDGVEVPMVLYRYLVGDPENVAIAVDSSLHPTALEVASGSNGTLSWSIEPGAYVLYFPQYALVDALSTMGRSFPDVVVRFEVELE